MGGHVGEGPLEIETVAETLRARRDVVLVGASAPRDATVLAHDPHPLDGVLEGEAGGQSDELTGVRRRGVDQDACACVDVSREKVARGGLGAAHKGRPENNA